MGMSIVPRGLQVDLVMALDLYLHIIYIYINILSFKSELHRLLSLIFYFNKKDSIVVSTSQCVYLADS